MSDSSRSQSLLNNIFERLHVNPNPNATFKREFFPTVPASSDHFSVSKDVQMNPLNNTFIRLFLPREVLNVSSSTTTNKLPIMVFVHGGGFVFCSAATPVYHEFCSESASRLGALILSLNFRLAPEHRLPSPYEDVLEALTWVKDTKDEWIKEYGDLTRCVLMGESSGGNIVYLAGLMAAARFESFKPLIIRGLVLIQPFFGGLDKTSSELQLGVVQSQDANEMMWRFALPIVATQGHEYCDPTVGGGSKWIDSVRDLGWRVGVVASGGDPLFDRHVEFVRLLEGKGLKLKCMISKDDQHGALISDTTNKRKDLLHFVMDFLQEV